jgi:flagellar hook-associated protein 3 FlgL
MGLVTNGTLAFYSRSTTQMSAIRREAETLQSRLATGSRIDRSSEDPVAASRLRGLERTGRLGAIDAANAARAKDGLSLAAGTLASVAQDLARARELALWAATDTLSSQERASIGQEIAQLRLTILGNVNARDGNGQPLFAGEAGGAAYQLDAAGNAIYAGTNTSGDIALGEGQQVTRGVTGPEFLQFNSGGTPADLFAVLKTLGDALQGAAADPGAAASGAVTELDDALESLTRTQTIVGTRLAWIETVQDRQVAKAESRASETADIGGVDLATTIAEMQQMLTVLEASQAGFSRLSSLSLFDSI